MTKRLHVANVHLRRLILLGDRDCKSGLQLPKDLDSLLNGGRSATL